MYYYGARCYDPVLGRFTTADPIVADPTNPQALNRYSYVVNNPLKYTDPSGHGWFKKLRSWVKNLFRPDKIVKNTIKQATTFSIENIATTAMQLSGYDPGILTTLTIKAASGAAGSYVSSKAGDGLYGSGSGVYGRLKHNAKTNSYYYNDPQLGWGEVYPFATKIPGFDWHKDRNAFNLIPNQMPKWTKVGQLGRQPLFKYVDSKENRWIKDNPLIVAYYHEGYTTFRGTGDVAGSQVTYYKGQVVDSGLGMGTFDYVSPLKSKAGHYKYDVKRHQGTPDEYTPYLSTRF